MLDATIPVILAFAAVVAALSLIALNSAYSPDGPEPHEQHGIWILTALCACAWLAPPAQHHVWALPTVIAIAASIATTRAARRHRNAA